MNRLRRFLRLPHRLQRLATVVLFMAPRVNRRVRKAGYEATTDWLNRREQPTVEDLDKAIRTARIAQTVTAHMPGSYNCLTRSLIVWWLIGGDRSSVIRFGVSPNDNTVGLNFHAWVEKDGVVINDVADVAERFLPFNMPSPSSSEFDS